MNVLCMFPDDYDRNPLEGLITSNHITIGFIRITDGYYDWITSYLLDPYSEGVNFNY